MANPEHLEVLREGVEVWNAWRHAHGDIRPDLILADLSGADLSRADLRLAGLMRADLRGADLSGADLSGADLKVTSLVMADLRAAHLRGADLRGADLTGADLNGAYLRGAHLMMANLSRAKLMKADLSVADLREAHLADANLTGADLSRADLLMADLNGADLMDACLSRAMLMMANLNGANLTGARMVLTAVGGVDLREVKGLADVQHDGPSALSIDTVFRSEGHIPRAFLRGAGVPESFIENMGLLVLSAVGYHSVFISYSSRDQGFAERLYRDLQMNGVRCYYASHDMRIGDPVRRTLHEAIGSHDKLCLVLSGAAIASQWVEDEVESALAKERRQPGPDVLFPIRLDDAVMECEAGWAASVQARHIGDFRRWRDENEYKKAFERLLRDLRAETDDDGAEEDSGDD